jgi:hypothetical protein
LEDADDGPMPHSSTVEIGADRIFSVPNTVVDYQMAGSVPVDSPAISKCRSSANLTARLFQIAGFDVVTVSDGSYLSFQNAFESVNTIAFLFAGHGTVNDTAGTKSLTLTDGWTQPLITVTPWQVKRPFGLAFLGLYACYSANNAAMPGVLAYWCQFVSPTGIFQGANGPFLSWSSFVTWIGPTPPIGM